MSGRPDCSPVRWHGPRCGPRTGSVHRVRARRGKGRGRPPALRRVVRRGQLRPAELAHLAAARRVSKQAIRDTGRDVVSAFVESPTFGGDSWLAHISLLSGIEVRDPDTNALLMTQKRDTLVTAFARAGYRTVAMMPGLWQTWPEGVFYGFDEIYNGTRLDYQGPAFGWWKSPISSRLHGWTRSRSRRASARRCSCSSRRSARTLRSAAPPYQPDWARMLTPHALRRGRPGQARGRSSPTG